LAHENGPRDDRPTGDENAPSGEHAEQSWAAANGEGPGGAENDGTAEENGGDGDGTHPDEDDGTDREDPLPYWLYPD